MNRGPRIRLRPAQATDEPLLARLFADARGGEYRALGLGERELEGLLVMQRRAQDEQYRAAFPRAEHSIVEAGGAAVGRVVLDRRPGEIRVVDLALLDACRGQGIGAGLLRALQSEAEGSGRTLGLRVARGNPARRLYARLGFREVAADEMYVEMAWQCEWQCEASGRADDRHSDNRGAAA